MQTCKTVKIVDDNDQGFVVINEGDFNADTQDLFAGGSVQGKLSISDIKTSLEALGVDYPNRANKADLLALLEGNDE